MDILCIGSAVVDIISYSMPDQVEWKEKQRIESIKVGIGGDAANQSIRLADIGRSVGLCAAVGADANGSMLHGFLRQRSVQTQYMARKKEYDTGTSLVLVNGSGKRNTFSIQGAHSMLSKADLPDLMQLIESGLRAISIGSLFSIPVLEEDGLMEYLMDAKQYGLKIFADLGSDKKQQGLEGIRKFLPLIDYFLPSLYDAAEMTGINADGDSREEIADAAKQIAEVYHKCGCKNVIIKCGQMGCYYSSESECGWVEAKQVAPVDTTGAGDCMAALFIHMIVGGRDLHTACDFACSGATLSTLSYGAADKKITIRDIQEYIGMR